ncbi:unnamed protein product [Amaranthus hypochondriacus]
MAEMDYLRQKWREYEEDEQDDYENNNNEENKGEIELGLGLSLNGKFGVDPNAGKLKSLGRSFSISNLSTNPHDGSGFPWVGGSGSSLVPLSRTCSLPVETEDDSRRRKEIQMLRRREAKRRRFEKMRNGSGSDGQGVWIGPPPLSQGSSGSSEFDSRSYTPPLSGMNRSTEAKSPQSVQSLDQNEHKSVSSKVQHEHKPPKLDPTRSISGTGEMVRNLLADMPCVSTKGDGPHGKRIDGFLYRYKKREEVRIVCVCHGNFLTPAEFIKHAGGGDVEHPLRHIVVNPSSFL